MSKPKIWFLFLTSLALFSLVLSACAQATEVPVEPTAAPTTPPEPTAAPTTPPEPTAAPTSPPEKFKIGLFVPVSGNTYEEARLKGAQEVAAKLNAEVVNFSGEYDPLEQINQIQDAIASETFDALLIHPIDSNAVVPVVEEALKAGLVVINADSPIGPDPDTLQPYPEGVSAFIGRTGKATGEWLGQAVIAACEGKDPCEVAYLIGIQALTIDQVRYQNLEETVKPHANIKIVAFQEGLYRQDKSYEVMQNVFQANPGIDVVASSGDQMTLGAEKAANDAGLTGIAFIGNGASIEGCQALAEGRFFATIADIPYTQGQLLVETAVNVLTGQPFEKSIDLNTVSPPLPAEGPVIDTDSLASYECQW
jgi:ribose transport system substrate-binding protein